jgi:hypothetical protein
MNSALVVVKLATSNYGLARAIYTAHQMACAEPYLVDFPGLDNPRWADRHDHAVGRFALIYGDAPFCQRVRDALEPLRANAAANQAFALIGLPTDSLSDGIWDGVQTVRVRRRALRKASEAAARKSAQRLAAKFQREGRVPEAPIVERARFALDAQNRWGAIVNPGTDRERVEKSILTLPSSSGRHFTNALSREPSVGAAFFGARDGYGFAAGRDGGSVPNVDEQALFKALIGEEDGDA